jgi:hypothetical protein
MKDIEIHLKDCGCIKFSSATNLGSGNHLDILNSPNGFVCSGTFKGKKKEELLEITSKREFIDYCIKYKFLTLEEAIAGEI